jgi:hypothetical protein
MAYSYDSIPVGYYDAVFHRRAGIQSKWHHDKFRRIIAEIGESASHLDMPGLPGSSGSGWSHCGRQTGRSPHGRAHGMSHRTRHRIGPVTGAHFAALVRQSISAHVRRDPH